jgi:transposase
MQTIDRRAALFVGVDVHKDTHTAVALSPFGEKKFELTISNEERDFVSLVKKARKAAHIDGLSPHFGLEDVHSWGERLSTFLVEAGVPVYAVAPVLVDGLRKTQTHPEKTDSLDARGVAEVMIQRIDMLPLYTLTEEARTAKQIRELSVEREYLVTERSRLKNQLHFLLHRVWNSGYAVRFANPFAKKALRYWSRHLPRTIDPILARRTRRVLKRTVALTEEIAEIEQELKSIVIDSGHTLHTASGCGTVLAAELIGEIGDIRRFRSPAALAKFAGCAPRERSSGKTNRHCASRSGNRRLNRGFHRMALSQISITGNPVAKAYFKRKVAEGKSKSQALVCLRRQMVNVVWMLMKHKIPFQLPPTLAAT